MHLGDRPAKASSAKYPDGYSASVSAVFRLIQLSCGTATTNILRISKEVQSFYYSRCYVAGALGLNTPNKNNDILRNRNNPCFHEQSPSKELTQVFTVTASPTHSGSPGTHLPVVSFPSIPWSPLASTAALGDGVPATTTKKNHPL